MIAEGASVDSPGFGDGWHGWVPRCEDVMKAPCSWGFSVYAQTSRANDDVETVQGIMVGH